MSFTYESFFENAEMEIKFNRLLWNENDAIVLVGDGANGKTCLAEKLVKNHPNQFVHHGEKYRGVMYSKMKKSIVTVNDERLHGLPLNKSYDVVYFNKKFI